MKIREIGVFVITLFIVLLFASGCFNKPPNVPEIVQVPESTFTRAQTLVRVSTTDPNNNAIYYIMDWDDGVIDTFPNEEGASPYPSGETVAVSHLYGKWSPSDDPHEKTFEVKASAKDDKGKIQKNWSASKSIRVIYNDEPNRPEIFPVHDTGAIKTPQTFKAVAIDPQGDSVAYRFSFFGANEWTAYIRSGDTISADATFPTTGTKKVWVIAKDTKSSQSFSSDTVDFWAIDEGYVTKTFQAETRADAGETDTVGMQSSPAIALVGGIEEIFIGSEGGQLYRIKASNMNRDYYKYPDVEEPFDEDPWGNSPAVNVTAGHWYIANDQGELYCWTLEGSKVWRYPGAPVTAFNNWDFTDAAFNSGNVYVVNRDYDSLYVLNDISGTRVGYYAGFGITTAPTIDAQGNVYIGDDSGYVYKLPATGSPMTPTWKLKLNGSISTSAIIDASGTIYVGANVALNGYLYALNPDSTIKWTYTIGENILTSPAIGTDNNIYFCDDGGRVHAVDASSGSLKAGWSLINLNANSSSPAFAADDKFYLNTDDQRVFCININGTIRWETQLPISGVKKYRKLREDFVPSPVIGADGNIYVSTGEDDIGLYQLKGRAAGIPANTAWPMFRHDRNHSGKAGFTPGR
jgi:hypothetical protein